MGRSNRVFPLAAQLWPKTTRLLVKTTHLLVREHDNFLKKFLFAGEFSRMSNILEFCQMSPTEMHRAIALSKGICYLRCALMHNNLI
jgi:hypothetical protein